jgi:hypothetical protein
MRFEIVTIFPGFFAGIVENGILRRAGLAGHCAEGRPGDGGFRAARAGDPALRARMAAGLPAA